MAKQRQIGLTTWLARTRRFIEELPSESIGTRPILRKLHSVTQFVYLVVQGFIANRCPLRAAALCYTTLLALVPLFAVVFGVSKSFLRDKSANVVPAILDAFVKNVAPQLDLQNQAKQQVVDYIQSFIANINTGALTAFGSLLLILVAIRLLATIEQTFNDIWGVQRGRSIWRKVVYYWTSVTLGPLILISAMAVTGTAEFANVLGKLAFVPGAERVLLYLAPYVILWVGFALMYGLMPNTRVRFHAALIGGIVGGTLWQLNSLLNTLYVSRVVTYSKIYGSLGIVPVFLVGLYFSWLIVLLGAQVSFAAQNIRNYLQQQASQRIDQAGRELLACQVVLQTCRHFLRSSRPPTAEDIAEQLHAPLQALNQLVHRLIEGGVLVEIASNECRLQPARPPDSITVADVLHVVRTADGKCGDELKRPGSVPVEQLLFDLEHAARTSSANVRFSDLVSKSAAE
jgi:membrane protein